MPMVTIESEHKAKPRKYSVKIETTGKDKYGDKLHDIVEAVFTDQSTAMYFADTAYEYVVADDVLVTISIVDCTEEDYKEGES